MLHVILFIYALVDIAFLVFLVQQYKLLMKSEEYTTDSLINKFIIGVLAIGGMIFTLALLICTVYYIINQ